MVVERDLDGAVVDERWREGPTLPVMAGDEVKHEVEIWLVVGVYLLQSLLQRVQLAVEHRYRLDGVNVPATRVAASQTRDAALFLGSRRHRRLRPGRLVLEVLDLAPSSEHELEATIGLADVVQPSCERDVLGKP